jgi:hypothetical protein
MRQIVLVKWNADATQEQVQRVLDVAPKVFADSVFVSVEHGPGLQLVPSFDWGFVGEVARQEDVAKWVASEPHSRLKEVMLPILSEVASIQLDF